MVRILFVAAHRFNRSPSQRFRFEQYFKYFEQNNFKCELSYLIDEASDKHFYKKGSYLKKFKIVLKAIKVRRKDILKTKNGVYDIIFIQREALMIGGAYFEKKFSKTNAKIIFDFDDSIWLPNISEANKNLEFLKNYNKTAKIISLADHVIAGNNYLAQFAKKYSNKITVIPTTVDTNIFKKNDNHINKEKVVIGWSGSKTTIEHFKLAIPILKKIKKKYRDQIDFKIIGDENFYDPILNVKGVAWSSETEVLDLNEIDIGIMPLPDDEWSKGKCGLKGLTYMSLEIPTIMSPVGVNCEIIEHGINGYLAKSESEWISIISMLIEAEELRNKIGKQARQTVIQRYSVHSQKENYLKILNSLSSKP